MEELNLDEFDIENKKENDKVNEESELKLNINKEVKEENNKLIEELDLNAIQETTSKEQIENEEIKEVKEIIKKDLYNENLDDDLEDEIKQKKYY